MSNEDAATPAPSVNPVVQAAADAVKNQKMRVRIQRARRANRDGQVPLFEIPGVTE